MAVSSPPRRERLWPHLLVSGLVLAGVAAASLTGALPRLTASRLADQLLWPLLRLLCFMGLGLLVGQAIESLGWGARLGRWLAPVLRWGRLKAESGAAFTAACFSGLLANTLLMTMHQEGRLSRQELRLSYLFNSTLPVFLLHLPTTFFIIVPLTRQAGLIYLGLTLAAALLRAVAILAYSHWRPASSAEAGPGAAPPPPPPPASRMDICRKFRRRFLRVLLYTLPIYVGIFVLNDLGLFTWLRQLSAHVALDFLPMEAAGVVIFSLAAEFTAGMAAAGALLDAGALTVKQTVLALILGNLAATPIRALRHQLPSHAGIFTPRLGAELLLLSQALRLASLVLVAVVYGVWG
ncbi:MAG: nucleoside recognition domain-containing protein [Deltaproteobacteria bacterium]|nr:nucleoside recognition domain-containing protein [Deltaproteobacteria bacterium]